MRQLEPARQSCPESLQACVRAVSEVFGQRRMDVSMGNEELALSKPALQSVQALPVKVQSLMSKATICDSRQGCMHGS